ncbi:MAG TPA: AraC family transcriptional regulator, partial [Xanthomonadales bacterium]|nr:AraC family transcriptional regulator [Xanthomonadales bacterium]
MMGILWRVLETYGLEPSQAINPAYYQPGNKGNEQRRLSFEEFDEVQVRTLALCQDPAMGLRIAQVLNPSHFGALGHALLACDSLMSAFQIIQRYVRMANETVQAVITETGDTVKIRIEEGKQHSHPDLSADLALTSVLTMCRFIFGPQLVPQRVQLRRTRPDNPSPWFEVYGPGVQFAQAEDHLAFHIKDAQKPLTGSNQKLVKVHEDIMQRYLLRKDRDSVVNQARLGLMESLPSGRVTEEDLAASLHISKRTLHRKLRDQNLT